MGGEEIPRVRVREEDSVKRRRLLQKSRGGCCELKVLLLGIWWEEDRKWSPVEVNGLLTRQDRRPAMCVCVRV